LKGQATTPSAPTGPQLGAFARRLQLDDVAHHVVLGRAQHRALGGDATGGVAQAPDGQRARPLARGAVQALRHPAARLGELLDRYLGVLALARVEPDHRAHAVGVQRRQDDRRVRAQPGRETGILGRGHHEHRDRRQSGHQLAERGPHLLAGDVDVVEHQQRRPPRAPNARQHGERRLRRARPGRVEHRASVAVHLAGQLSRQPRLAHPARARHHYELAGAGVRAPPPHAQGVELGLPAHQRRAGVELGRELDRRGRRRIELSILAQDRLVQPPQLRARLHPDLLHEHRPRLAVSVQRLRLPATAIQRQHALRVQPLAQRVLGHERLELGGDLAVPAGRQVAIDRQLERRDAKPLETPDLGRSERLVRHIR
jgi:hypothetical protein